MQTLSSTLLSAQRTRNAERLCKIVFSSGATRYGYDLRDRLLRSSLIIQPDSHTAQVELRNTDEVLSDLALRGYQAVISHGYMTGVARSAWVANTAYAEDDIVIPTTANGYQYRCSVAGTSHATTEPTWPTDLGAVVTDGTVTWEMDGLTGSEYARKPPLKVKIPDFFSSHGKTAFALSLFGIPDQMKLDCALSALGPDASNTDTVKTWMGKIAAKTLAPYTHCDAITIDWDSEDALIDVYTPKDTMQIYEGESRWAMLEKLIGWTKCVMRVGADGHIHVSSPTIARTETLRPDAAGDETNLTPSAGANWQCVDAVDDTDYVKTFYTATAKRDFYNLPALTAVAGVISKITVHARAKNNVATTGHLGISVKTGGVVSEKFGHTLTSSWVDYSDDWETNPATEVAWTIADIASLQIGVSLRETDVVSGLSQVSQAYVVVTYSYDYTFDDDYTDATAHTFFTKDYRNAIVLPNKITVHNSDRSYTGNYTSSASYALMPKDRSYIMTLASSAQGTAIATAMIQKLEQEAEKGTGTVPMNVGQELYDYVDIVDSVQGDERAGNIGFLRFDVARGKFDQTFGFGKILLGSMIGSGAGAATGGSGSFSYDQVAGLIRDVYDNLNSMAEVLNRNWFTLEQVQDGTDSKAQTFTAEPTTPYAVGDLWIQSGTYKRCTTARASGAYNAADWTSVTQDEITDTANYKRVPFADFSDNHILLSSTIKDSNNRTVTDAEKTIYIGKTKVFRQATEPASGMQAGDIWIDTTGGYDLPWTYSGAAWIRAYTYISGGYIQTGTIDASIVTVAAGPLGVGVTIDGNGITIAGENLLIFKRGADIRGYIFAASGTDTFTISAPSADLLLQPGSAKNVKVFRDLLPTATAEYDLGVTGTRFRNLWLSGDVKATGNFNSGAGFLYFDGSNDLSAWADQVAIGGYEISAGHRALAIASEDVVVAETDETKFSHKVPVRWNGATYYIMLTVT